ncbi:hypothetical protein AXF42_Ash007781 [Apostasia shenzhenica]|uniref:Uncharacterized protein n=1 Tax=Apostasia shenzhenica TaxID=1088818 RepID=A0A2I0B5C1_9ASPA|nr:hypothetical protein AXF42_Ash007781 [Apostasia shenzhenica]
MGLGARAQRCELAGGLHDGLAQVGRGSRIRRRRGNSQAVLLATRVSDSSLGHRDESEAPDVLSLFSKDKMAKLRLHQRPTHDEVKQAVHPFLPHRATLQVLRFIAITQQVHRNAA